MGDLATPGLGSLLRCSKDVNATVMVVAVLLVLLSPVCSREEVNSETLALAVRVHVGNPDGVGGKPELANDSSSIRRGRRWCAIELASARCTLSSILSSEYPCWEHRLMPREWTRPGETNDGQFVLETVCVDTIRIEDGDD